MGGVPVYQSASAAARALELSPGNVSGYCRGERKRTSEYEFKWAPPAEDQHDKTGEVWRDVESGTSGIISCAPARKKVKFRAVYS